MQESCPDIIMIVLDTHRVDRLSAYGYPQATSPNIDSFASQSTLFLNAISPAQWTIPSHSSMFTGVYPSSHGTVQSGDALPPGLNTVAEYLRGRGYQTIALCNNPLVGVLNNGLQRGFNRFYNFGGAVPSLPSRDDIRVLRPLGKARSVFRGAIKNISDPIQHAVAASPKVFQFILNPMLVPLWSRFANFKGNTGLSIRETTSYLQRQSKTPTGKGSDERAPFFLFLNLMETHLPYHPPRSFSQRFAPVWHDEPQARDFMKAYNTQALRWLLPMEEPYSELESHTLSSMYDAEVAYQDHLLGQLFEALEHPAYENALVLIVSDHGEMLGEHQIMGHGLGLYQELVHVPLLIRFPGQKTGQVVHHPVSTVRVFHTFMEAAGIGPDQAGLASAVNGSQAYLEPLSQHPEIRPRLAFSEAYPPVNVIKIMEKITPDLLQTFHSEAINWAVYKGEHKMIRVAGVQEDVFHLGQDPREQAAVPDPTLQSGLGQELNTFLAWALAHRPSHASGPGARDVLPSEDERLMERLRNLGYLE